MKNLNTKVGVDTNRYEGTTRRHGPVVRNEKNERLVDLRVFNMIIGGNTLPTNA